MKRTAIISDIHGNLEALESTFADIDGRGIEDVICLGDVVGYGPNPAECIDLVQARCRAVIRGNHDEAVIHGAVGFNPVAREAIDWTQRTLRPRLLKPVTRQRWSFIEGLPEKLDWNGYLLVHGSPRQPTSEYIMERDIFLGNDRMFDEIFGAFETVCFVGHTHMPGVFSPGPRWRPQRDIDGAFSFDGTKMVINVGSVGQPRDRDPRACYVSVDPAAHVFEFHRVAYPFEKTQAKIRAIEELDNGLADRLGYGA